MTKPMNEVKIDNVKGAGSVPYNQEVDYFGLRVQMKPSTFLDLAAPLGDKDNSEMEEYIRSGGAIGAPFLDIAIPKEWDDGDFTAVAKIQGHEGRHRMRAIMAVEGDTPIEVHLFPKYYRARDLTPEFVRHINAGLYAEKSSRIVRGPLFTAGAVSEASLGDMRSWFAGKPTPKPQPTRSADMRAYFNQEQPVPTTQTKKSTDNFSKLDVPNNIKIILWKVQNKRQLSRNEYMDLKMWNDRRKLVGEAGPIKLTQPDTKVTDFIEAVYTKYPQQFQNNHVMPMGGEGDDQQFAMFELTPSFSRRGAVEVKWFQAYPLRQGVGSRAMQELQALAKDAGIALTLFPWDKGQVSQAKLTKFYKSQGFQPTVKGAKNMAWTPESILDEAFDQPYPMTWEKSEADDSMDALARLPDGSNLSIMFNMEYDEEGEEVIQVEFHRNNSQEVTGDGDAQRVFATVLAAIQQYIKEHKPKRLTFSASKEVEPDQNSESRAKLYDRLVIRYARTWGYRPLRADTGTIVRYELSRLKESATEYVTESTGWTALEVVESILGKDRVTSDDDELVQGMYYVYESNSPPQFEDTEEPGQTGGAIRLHNLEATDPKAIAEAAHEACHAYAHSKSSSGMLYTNEKIINNLAEIWLKKNLSGTALHFALEHILGSKLHYGSDHMARSVAEARTNPEQNVKLESGMKELEAIAKDINDPENWAISMTGEPKLGINPQVGISEDTPKGIYFYPLNYTLGMIKGRRPLPWGENMPYIQLFQYDRSGEMTQQTQVDPVKLKQALLQYCPEEVIQQAIDEPEYDGTPYWTIYDCLSRLGKSDETNVVRWNKVLRDLGFTSVYDPGKGWIAYNEPTQGVVLDPRIIKQLKTIVNKQQSSVVTPAKIEQAIFDTMDIELARNRAWQAYDPDGTKLRAAAKEYAKDPKFKPYMGKPGTEEIYDKASGYGRWGAVQLGDEAWAWFRAQPAQQQPVKQESVEENFADGKGPGRAGDSQRHGRKRANEGTVTEGGWASAATQDTVITPAIIAEAVAGLDEFAKEYNTWQAQSELGLEIKMGKPKGSGTYYERDLKQDPDREYGDIDIECFIHSRPGASSAQLITQYKNAISEFTRHNRDFASDNGTNIIMTTSAGPAQVDLIYTFNEHADWSRALSPEYRVKGVISTSLTSALAEVLNFSFSSQGVQVKTRAGRPVSFRQSKDTELTTVSTNPESWARDMFQYYYTLANGQPYADRLLDLDQHPGLKDEQRLADIVHSIRSLATELERNNLLGNGALDHVANAQTLLTQVSKIYAQKLEAVISSSKFDKAATPAAEEKAKKTKLMLAKYRNEVAKLLLN